MEDGKELQPDDVGMDAADCLRWQKFGVAEVKMNGHVRKLNPVPEEKCKKEVSDYQRFFKCSWDEICNKEF
jgi:hypothetical protein